MKGWIFPFKLFLLFLFIFITIVVGNEDILIYVKENLFRTATYFLFTIIIIYIATWQRKKRSAIPPQQQAVLPAEEDRFFVGRIDDQDYGTSIEVFRKENSYLDGRSEVEYFAHVITLQTPPPYRNTYTGTIDN